MTHGADRTVIRRPRRGSQEIPLTHALFEPVAPMARLFLALAMFLALPLHAGGTDELRTYAVKLINRERARANLSPLKPDEAAARLAQARAEALIAGNDDGLTPYMRWSFNGGTEAIRENVAGFTVSYAPTEVALRDLVRRSIAGMMDEVPPLNGRRGTILDPLATHAGVGIAVDGGRFRIVHEILRRYVDLSAPAVRDATTADSVMVSGKPLHETTFDSITVHFEEWPDRTPKRRERLPERKKDYLPKLGTVVSDLRHAVQYEYDNHRLGEVTLVKSGEFAVSVPFTEGPGIYTIAVWVRYPGYAVPFAATSVSIRVEQAPPGLETGASPTSEKR
jgi:hypothetical protein